MCPLSDCGWPVDSEDCVGNQECDLEMILMRRRPRQECGELPMSDVAMPKVDMRIGQVG